MITPADVSAVIVTRGDVELAEILASLPYDDVVVWDNSQREDLKTSGRYAAFAECRNEIVYVQDDDHILLDHPGLLAAYEPGKVVTNMSENWLAGHDYRDNGMVGKGAIMDRGLPALALGRYLAIWPADDLFRLWPDMIVTTLTPTVHVDLAARQLPWGYAPNRMNQRRQFRDEKRRMLKRARFLRDQVPA